jgi:hypothetical protein
VLDIIRRAVEGAVVIDTLRALRKLANAVADVAPGVNVSETMIVLKSSSVGPTMQPPSKAVGVQGYCSACEAFRAEHVAELDGTPTEHEYCSAQLVMAKSEQALKLYFGADLKPCVSKMKRSETSDET